MLATVVALLLTAQAPAQEARPAVDPELRELALRAVMRDADTPKLVAMYDNQKNAEHRELILRRLADRDDAQARKKLTEVASQEADHELREVAVRMLASRGDTAAVIAMYDAQKDPELKEVILRQLGRRSDDAARQKLMAIARGDGDADLRETAARVLASRASTKTLIELFDSVREPEVREAIVRELGKRKDDLAQQKLLAIIEGK